MPTILSAPLAALALAVSLPDVRSADIPFEEVGNAVLAEAGVPAADSGESGLQPLLERACVRCDLGLYELYVPKARLEDAAHAESFRAVAIALVDAQREWLEWLAGGEPADTATMKDVAAVRGWVESWKPAKLAAANGATSIGGIVAPGEPALAALERFNHAMRIGDALGLARTEESTEPVVFCPTREDFVGLVCASGILRPDNRATFWDQQIARWTYCYVDRFKVVCGQIPGPGVDKGDWKSGLSMSERSPTGLQEQFVQLTANSLFDNYYGERIPPSFAGALSINLVIDVFGQCDTRVDGDLRERRTQAREVFVPGGMSEGGRLPPNWAESKWRTGGGADRFVSALKIAQASGAKEKKDAREKHAWFLLADEASSKRAIVRGPFLGPAATVQELDEALEGDRLDFLRSYRTCFVWWLQNESSTSGRKARTQFATLLRTLATSEDGDIGKAVGACFDDDALSTADLGKDELEGRFLHWLTRQ